MDDLDIEIARILADCANEDDLEKRIARYAGLLQRLASCMVKGQDDAEARIRKLYSDLADMAVEHLDESRPFPCGKLH